MDGATGAAVLHFVQLKIIMKANWIYFSFPGWTDANEIT